MTTLHLTLSTDAAHLEFPSADAEKLAPLLECTLERGRREFTLVGPSGCALVFDEVGPLALLREVRIADDENGLFTVQVLGRLLASYDGELDATVVTTPADVYPSQLTVRSGESGHPLFATVMPSLAPTLSPAELARVEALLEEAREAWQQWQRTRGQSSSPTSR